MHDSIRTVSLRPSLARKFVDSNPFYNLLELVRGPLLGHAPSAMNWIYSLGLLVFGSAVALVVYGRFRSRIPYWI